MAVVSFLEDIVERYCSDTFDHAPTLSSQRSTDELRLRSLLAPLLKQIGEALHRPEFKTLRLLEAAQSDAREARQKLAESQQNGATQVASLEQKIVEDRQKNSSLIKILRDLVRDQKRKIRHLEAAISRQLIKTSSVEKEENAARRELERLKGRLQRNERDFQSCQSECKRLADDNEGLKRQIMHALVDKKLS